MDPQVTASFFDHLMPTVPPRGGEEPGVTASPAPIFLPTPQLHLLSVPSQEGSEQSRRLLRIQADLGPPPSSVLTGLERDTWCPSVRCFIFLCFRVPTCE